MKKSNNIFIFLCLINSISLSGMNKSLKEGAEIRPRRGALMLPPDFVQEESRQSKARSGSKRKRGAEGKSDKLPNPKKSKRKENYNKLDECNKNVKRTVGDAINDAVAKKENPWKHFCHGGVFPVPEEAKIKYDSLLRGKSIEGFLKDKAEKVIDKQEDYVYLDGFWEKKEFLTYCQETGAWNFMKSEDDSSGGTSDEENNSHKKYGNLFDYCEDVADFLSNLDG